MIHDQPSRDMRGRGPRGRGRSDARIHEDVCDRLTEASEVDAADIDVEVQGGEVALRGTVLDRGMRQRAEEIAEAVGGVAHVRNELRVRP